MNLFLPVMIICQNLPNASYRCCFYSQSIEDDHVAGGCSGLMQDLNPDVTEWNHANLLTTILPIICVEVTHISPIKSVLYEARL